MRRVEVVMADRLDCRLCLKLAHHLQARFLQGQEVVTAPNHLAHLVHPQPPLLHQLHLHLLV